MSLFKPSFDLSPYTYRGEHLREIAFPLGGIGTGCVSLDGRGGLRDWEIFNRPNKHTLWEATFPAIWVQAEGEAPKAMTVQGPRVRNWVGEGSGFWSYGQGQFFKQMDGLPGFDEVEFSGTFPFARVSFKKKGLPLEVELCAFNPFIPLDIPNSSFPGACLVYRLKNTSDKRVEATLAWSMMNPIGEMKPDPKGGEDDRARNEVFESADCTGILFSNARFEADSPHHGTVALSTNWKNLTLMPKWKTGGWFDPIQTFWNVFGKTGRLEADAGEPNTYRCAGSVGAVVSLEPGEEVEIPFFISWVFPVAEKYWGDEKEPLKGTKWKPHYAAIWPDAAEVARGFFKNYEQLTARTRKFEEALFTSTLPPEIIECVASTASILHSPTVIRLEDGTFWAWEGCSPEEGCCAGTCSHVWNYALTHAFLFPEMQWSMRRTEYKYNFNCGPMGKDGALDFRVMLPLGTQTNLWHAASDGQLGGIVQLYRDWRISGDEEALRELWPSAKRALAFAWVQWDRDRDGLVDGDQHNTYDINFQGPNPLTQFFYLAALRAGEEIARHLGDEASANQYRELYEAGRVKTKERLWNGEFFIQENAYTEPDAPKYQHGKGCLTDQVFGQLSASLAGLGDLVEPELVKKTLESIYRYNFRDPLGEHENLQRVYAVADEAGLLLCSWPNGGRPHYPFVYSDEVWVGIEYQAAAHMAWEGMVEECRAIARGLRKRFDGVRRNPYNEYECGSHYARALASYGMLLAFSGFTYDAVDRKAEMKPRWKPEGEFRCFFGTPHGWGTATVAGGETKFELAEGALFPTQA